MPEIRTATRNCITVILVTKAKEKREKFSLPYRYRTESSNLSIGNISTAESDLVAGTVIDQNIAAGTEIEEHTKISITVSSGPSGNGG